jgi:hypothetical protein
VADRHQEHARVPGVGQLDIGGTVRAFVPHGGNPSLTGSAATVTAVHVIIRLIGR